MYRLVRAMCRPARISTGRSSRPTSGRVSSGDPQSRSASAPASRLVLACLLRLVQGGGAGGRIADMAVRVDEAGQHPAGQFDGVGDRAVDEPAAADPQVDRLAGGRVDPANPKIGHFSAITAG